MMLQLLTVAALSMNPGMPVGRHRRLPAASSLTTSRNDRHRPFNSRPQVKVSPAPSFLRALACGSLHGNKQGKRTRRSLGVPCHVSSKSTAIAKAWHDDVINKRNPTILSQIFGPEVVHHAAGGYPKVLNAEGIAGMMGDLLTAFPDLLITFDQFIAKDDFVVERYTASGTHQGHFGNLQPTNRTATWTGINIFRIGCERIVEVWSEVDAEGRRRQLIVPMATPR